MHSQYGNGALAERLGTGLQNLLQRFDSARHLTKMPLSYLRGILVIKNVPKSVLNVTHLGLLSFVQMSFEVYFLLVVFQIELKSLFGALLIEDMLVPVLVCQ